MLCKSVFAQYRCELRKCSYSSIENFRKRIEAHLDSTRGERYRNLGKLLPRERIQSLLDPESSFLELSLLAGDGLYGKDLIRSGGLITGIGVVSRKLCMIMCNEFTVKGGSIYPIGLKKYLRAQEIARECKLISIHLTESGGAALPYQADLFVEGGRNFYNIAKMSSEGLPQVTVVFGSCTAGAAYVPAMCEENIMVDQKGYVFLGGPPLVQAATGEIVSAEELGGARVHCTQSGVSDHFAVNDENAINIARNVVMNANYCSENRWAENFSGALLDWNGDALNELAKQDSSTFSAHEIIAKLADKNSFNEFKELYGVDTVTGFCNLAGIHCGIVANNGLLSRKGALKATSFIRICSQRKIPIVFIQNTTAKKEKLTLEQEDQRGKAIAGLMSVLACSEVPKITLNIGRSTGIENYAFCGRSFSPNFLFTWPTAQFSSHDDSSSLDGESINNINEQQEAVYASARLLDDGVIEPKDTKRVLALSLSCALNKPIPDSKFPVVRM